MDELIGRIREQEAKASPLEPAEQERNELLQQVKTYANTYLNALPQANSFSQSRTDREAFKLDGKPKTIGDLLNIFSKEVAEKGLRASSGGHLGYIPGGGIFASALGDYLAAITNEYSGISFASPGAVAMEQEVVAFLKGLFGFPDTAVGNLTSGGSIANMIGLTAARDKYSVKGVAVEKSVVYLSPQLHHSNTKALRILGLEDVQIRLLKLDTHSRIIVADLNEKIALDKSEGLNPFLIIASAGTTDTGAIDPLKEIAAVAKSHDLWFHIDAAYGGFFILTEGRKKCFEGIELADSLSVDPHKALFIPYGLGAVMVKDREAVFHSHHHSAHYMQDALEEAATDPSDVSPELTKHFRALRLWLPLQLYGLQPFIAALEEKLLLTRYFRQRVQELGFAVGPEPDLSVTYFWWPSFEGNENDFNRKLLKEIHREGSVFLSSTMIGERFVIRLAVLSFRTKLETIDKTLQVLQRLISKLV